MKSTIKLFSIVLSVVMVYSALNFFCENEIRAAEKDLDGQIIEFGEKEEFKSTGTSDSSVNSYYTVGKLHISGDYSEISNKDKKYSFMVNSGNLKISFKLSDFIRNATDTQWHVVSDGSKKLDGFELEDKVDEGAIVVLSSFDQKNWSLDEEYTDVFNKKKSLNTELYETNNIQLINGCYYKIVVLYKLEKETGKKSYYILDETETKRIALVYEFYAENQDKVSEKASHKDIPRQEMGTVVKTTKDKGFSDSLTIDKNDPHFGWDLGYFVVNGWTSNMEEDGEPVYLKNVGDKVKLWFVLEQDILKLNGNSDYQINGDYNGYDQYFGVPATDFKRGSLIIKYTDEENKTTDPIIYTDFLAADCQTKADTVVQLFEEGDYEVALDYEIVDKSGLGIPTYTNYRIFIKFKIRNSNCMVYPFDLTTGSELADYGVAPDGFMLDTAKSQYLEVGIKKYAITKDADGKLRTDLRVSTTVKKTDNEFTDEGFYEFTVHNKYTNDYSTKTIFVGSSPYLYSLKELNNDVDAYNKAIDEGAVVNSDGSLVYPIETVIEEPENTEETQVIESQNTEVVSTTTSQSQVSTSETSVVSESNNIEIATEKTKSDNLVIVLLVVLIVATLGIGVTVVYFVKKMSNSLVSVNTNSKNPDSKAVSEQDTTFDNNTSSLELEKEPPVNEDSIIKENEAVSLEQQNEESHIKSDVVLEEASEQDHQNGIDKNEQRNNATDNTDSFDEEAE